MSSSLHYLLPAKRDTQLIADYGWLQFIQHFVRVQINLKIRFYLTACLITSDSRNIVFYCLLCACARDCFHLAFGCQNTINVMFK